MTLSILFLIILFLFGLATVEFFDSKRKFGAIELAGASGVIGVTAGSYIILALSLISGSLFWGIALFSIVGLIFSAWRFRALARVLRRIFKRTLLDSASLHSKNNLYIYVKAIRPWAIGLCAVLFIYIAAVSIVLFWGESHTMRSSFIGWGDMALHISLTEHFSVVSPFNLAHPLAGGARLTYPFMIDFISGIFRALGADQVLAFRIPVYLFGISALLLLFSAAARILKSKFFAVIALVLILWGSGSGFRILAQDAESAYQTGGLSAVVNMLVSPPHTYTHLDNRTGGKQSQNETNDNIVWIVPIIAFLEHQKSFILGLALFSLIFLGIWVYAKETGFWRYGLLAGFLPFAHGHTLVALFLLMATLLLFFLAHIKKWLGFAAATALVAAPQVMFLLTGGLGSTIGRPRLFAGWMSCEHTISWLHCDLLPGTDTNILAFWSKNFGIVFFLWSIAIAAILVALAFSQTRNRILSWQYAPFLLASCVLLAVPNLVVFQPWAYDNNKIIFYWWIIAILFGVVPVLQFLRRRSVWGMPLAAILIFFAIIAGGVDSISQILASSPTHSPGYVDGIEENKIIAKWIRENTQANALFLAAPAIDPVPVFLAGRPVYMGYEGWLWTHGISAPPLRVAIQKILTGDMNTACGAGIQFIMLDPPMKQAFPFLNEPAIFQKTELAVSTQGSMQIRVLRVRCSESR